MLKVSKEKDINLCTWTGTCGAHVSCTYSRLGRALLWLFGASVLLAVLLRITPVFCGLHIFFYMSHQVYVWCLGAVNAYHKSAEICDKYSLKFKTVT